MQPPSTRSHCSAGHPRSGIPGSGDGGALGVALPHEGIVLEQLLDGTGKERWCVEASNTSSTVSLGGAAQRSLGAGRVMMMTHRSDMLSGVVATSTTCLTRIILWFFPEDDDGSEEDGGGDCASVPLRVC